MRFFKYLVLIFASILATNLYAANDCKRWKTYDVSFDDITEAFGYWASKDTSGGKTGHKITKIEYYNAGSTARVYYTYTYKGDTKTYSYDVSFNSEPAACKCPAKDTVVPMFYGDSDPAPLVVCKPLGELFCSFSREENSVIINSSEGRKMVSLRSDSEIPQSSCTEKFAGKCDKTDPYGGCYTPPNDGCTRQKDGSIVCPPEAQPPKPDDSCKGATYCKRPPTGCDPGYVPGSFNGEQLCVKSGPSIPKPNDPNDPDNPNKCNLEYCPKPDDNQDCPTGYYPTTHNGQKICVKDNPNPNQPNPNDPNNSGGDGGGGASEPTGGDGGSSGSINLKPVIDAINALKSALLSALDGISKKITSLVEGQKQTNKKLDTSNEHLKNIKDETVKTNEKLDTSNQHLDKIEDATQAASEGIGETNKKLDKIFSDEGKEQIEQLGEQSSDPRYAQAEAEATTQVQKFANVLSYTSSHACISDLTVTNIPLYGSMTVPLSKWCDLLALVKILMKLAALMLSLRMIDATVRAF